MGNICCCCSFKSNIKHGNSLEAINQSKTKIIDENGTKHISPGSINPSIFTTQSGPPEDCKHVSKLSLNMRLDDQKGQVSGMACLADGHTVITDARNRIIKVFDPYFEYVHTLKTRHRVYEVVVVGFKDVAVTQGSHICFYEIFGRYITKREKCFYVGKNFRNISYNGTWFAVGSSDSGECRIKILDNDGVVRYEIPRVSTPQVEGGSNNLCGNLVLDPARDILYVSNGEEHCISCVDFHGNILWNSCDSVLVEKPRCVVVYESMIYFCDWNTNNVNCISMNGCQLYPVVKDNLKRPKFISFQRKQNRLVVYCAGERAIEVFQLYFSKPQFEDMSNETFEKSCPSITYSVQ